MSKPSYYSILPAEVRYDEELSPSQKILYSEITALANKYGYCMASNKYFADLYGVSTITISRWLNKLKEKGYVIVKISEESGNERKIYINNERGINKNVKTPININVKTPINKNVKHNNTSINNTSINNNNIYSPATQDDASEKIPYKEIIDYLNMKTGSQYKHTTKKTRELIRARWNEGFNLNDFKTVIDKKCVEWVGTEWEKFLRPVTLFGTKFESYLNQLSVERKKDKYQKQHDALRELYQELKEEEDKQRNFKRSEYR